MVLYIYGVPIEIGWNSEGGIADGVEIASTNPIPTWNERPTSEGRAATPRALGIGDGLN